MLDVGKLHDIHRPVRRQPGTGQRRIAKRQFLVCGQHLRWMCLRLLREIEKIKRILRHDAGISRQDRRRDLRNVLPRVQRQVERHEAEVDVPGPQPALQLKHRHRVPGGQDFAILCAPLQHAYP